MVSSHITSVEKTLLKYSREHETDSLLYLNTLYTIVTIYILSLTVFENRKFKCFNDISVTSLDMYLSMYNVSTWNHPVEYIP